MSIKQIAIFFTVAAFGLVAANLDTKALEAKAQINTGNMITAEIAASAPGEFGAVQIRLDVQGGSVKSVTLMDSSMLNIGTCDNGNTFDGNKVCVDIVSATPISPNAPLIAVELVIEGDLLVVATEEGNQYVLETQQIYTNNGIVMAQSANDDVIAPGVGTNNVLVQTEIVVPTTVVAQADNITTTPVAVNSDTGNNSLVYIALGVVFLIGAFAWGKVAYQKLKTT